jgi:hypothetical protein
MSRHEIFRREQKFYSVSHAVNFPLFISRLFIFCISRLFLFYSRLSSEGVWGGRSGARDTDGIEEKCVQSCGGETCRNGW